MPPPRRRTPLGLLRGCSTVALAAAAVACCWVAATSVQADTRGSWTQYALADSTSSPVVVACTTVIATFSWTEGACIQLPRPTGSARDALKTGYLELWARHFCGTSGGEARQFVYSDLKCTNLLYVESFPVALAAADAASAASAGTTAAVVAACMYDRTATCPNPSGTATQPALPLLQITLCDVADSAALSATSCSDRCVQRYYPQTGCAHVDSGDIWSSYQLTCSDSTSSTATSANRTYSLYDYSSATYDPLSEPTTACLASTLTSSLINQPVGVCRPFFANPIVALQVRCKDETLTSEAHTQRPHGTLAAVLLAVATTMLSCRALATCATSS